MSTRNLTAGKGKLAGEAVLIAIYEYEPIA
jgi:hypothetical protein